MIPQQAPIKKVQTAATMQYTGEQFTEEQKAQMLKEVQDQQADFGITK
jgi:beta-galactosidase